MSNIIEIDQVGGEDEEQAESSIADLLKRGTVIPAGRRGGKSDFAKKKIDEPREEPPRAASGLEFCFANCDRDHGRYDVDAGRESGVDHVEACDLYDGDDGDDGDGGDGGDGDAVDRAIDDARDAEIGL